MNNPNASLNAILQSEAGDFSTEHARYLLSLSFPEILQNDYKELSQKAQQGTLMEIEREHLEELLSANAFLVILKSKARVALRERGITV